MKAGRLRVVLLATSLGVVGGGTAVAQGGIADVCLEFAPGVVTEAVVPALVTSVAASIESRTALFPAPSVEMAGSRLDIASGHEGLPLDAGSCLLDGYEWTARFGRAFLEAGADQMLAEAPTTPGIDSDVTLEWYPDEANIRTKLEFDGPLGIPNGTCWIDDVLTVDQATGSILASGEQGVRTSLFAEGACDRFFDHLPEGGAGEQAVTLLPQVVTLDDGSKLRFVAEDVLVQADAVLVLGSLARD
jgi:hypothetical protein